MIKNKKPQDKQRLAKTMFYLLDFKNKRNYFSKIGNATLPFIRHNFLQLSRFPLTDSPSDYHQLKNQGGHTMAVMRRIKSALDPQGIMNPGKIFISEQE